MGLELTFEITLVSDYHVSAGYALDMIADSALHRDRDGVPVLRGTGLNGLLRESLRDLLQTPPLHNASYVQCQASGLLAEKDAQDNDIPPRFCGQHDVKQSDCPVCRVFGSPRTPKRWRVGSARPVGLARPAEVATFENEVWDATQMGGHIAPHARVSPRTRRAEAHKLFFREDGDRRLRFRFKVQCDTVDAQVLEEAAWLVAAARFVRHLGAARRRGQGVCEIHLKDVTASDFTLPALDEGQTWEAWMLAYFEACHFKGESIVLPDPELGFTPSTASAEPVRLLLVARLDEPLLVSQQAEAGNEFRTLDYIPGSALRGALAGRAAARYNLEQTDTPVYTAFAKLFLRHGVMFPTLYPAQYEKDKLYPAIPAPRDIFSCKLFPGFGDAGHGVKHLARRKEFQQGDLECARCEEEFGTATREKKRQEPGGDCPEKPDADQDEEGGIHTELKALEDFWSLQPGHPQRVKVHKMTEMHLHIDSTTHRASDGELFGFDALEASQYFVGELVCESRAAWEDLCALAGIPEDDPLTLHLGKASRRGYGKVTLWMSERETAPVMCPQSVAERVDLDQPIVMTLLTDAILPDSWGRFYTTFAQPWLSELLGVQVNVLHTFCGNRPVDTFNAHLGLPRWRDIAMAAGSSVGFEIAEPLTEGQRKTLKDTLTKLEHDGLGLRRNEGFGRAAFNHILYQSCEGIDDEQVAIPLGKAGMPLIKADQADAPDTRELAVEAKFPTQWESKLAQANQTPFAYPEFVIVARLLRAEHPASVDAVQKLVARLGHATELLPDLAGAGLEVRAKDQATLNTFQAGRAKPGLETLHNLAVTLDETVSTHIQTLPDAQHETTYAHCWRAGIEILADYIAAVAGEEVA